MRRLSGSVLIAGLTIGLMPSSVKGVQPSDRVFLLLVDDLHLDFRSTPRMRELVIRRVLPVLLRDGGSVGVVTTGYSSVSMAPTTDGDGALSVVRRITGNASRSDQILDPRQSDEQLWRAKVAIATAKDAIKALNEMSAGQKVLLYFSGGYGGQVVETELADLASAASRSGVAIYTFEARGLVGGPYPAPGVADERAWTAYARDAQNGLRNLAESTGGWMVSAPGELENWIAQVVRTASH